MQLKKSDLYFVPLGGCGHFGANLNLYHYDGQWLAIDCGMGFADERYPGVDVFLPDPSFIEEQGAGKLTALVITHAHEDHIGGVAYLWPRLKCPVYATPFTMEVLRRKISEVPYGSDIPLHEIPNQGKTTIGAFDLEWINMAHSIPDTSSLLITTQEGSILHSGDWNFDPKPMAGFTSDEKRLKEIGDQGNLLAYVGDSTNACVKGRSGSESELLDDFKTIFKRAKAKIGVTLFSSNVGRLRTVIEAAKETERYICMVGRSLKNMADIALEHGLIKEGGIFVTEEDAGHFPSDKIVYVLTGSQGEGRAQLPKVAYDTHPTVSFTEGDLVLFSARSIPGNERAITDMRNALIRRGIEVITSKDAHIHVSGHPARDEIIHMFQLTRPNAVIPVHGEHEHQIAHAEIARECQVKHTIVPENGTVIKISKQGLEALGQVDTALLGYDESRILPLDHVTIRERRKLSFNGCAFVSLSMDKKGEITDVQLSTIGLIDEEEKAGKKLIDEVFAVIDETIDALPKPRRLDEDSLCETVRIAVRRYFNAALNIKPITIVHLAKI